MRVLLNGRPALGPRSGIGWYTLRLGEALQTLDQVETVELAIGSRTAPLPEAMAERPAAQSGAMAVARSAVRTLMPPAGRQLLADFASRNLRREANRWSVFHETNYISPNVRLPLVTTVCDLSYIRHPECMPRHRRRWLNAYLHRRLTHSRAIISISRFTTDELTACFPQLDESRIFTTPLGVDHTEFHADQVPGERERLRSTYDLPDQFALYLGTLEPRKNLQGLLRGYSQLPQRLRREFPLVLAGSDGWRQTCFRDLITDLQRDGCLNSLGYVPQTDVPGLMRAATAFCFPSLYEGFGLPALEAAACGTAVVCGNASSLPEVMGDAAHYVDPHCADSIAEGLRCVLQDESHRADLAARAPVQAARFTWRRCAEATLQAYLRAA